MMNIRHLLLPEYRCPCGKLLFKGVLMLSEIEMKCRYCGKVRTIGEAYEELGDNQYAALAALATEDAYQHDDPSPIVIDMTDSMLSILGWDRDELIGKEVRSFDPLMDARAYGNLWKLFRARKFQPFTIEVYQPKKGGGFVKSRSRTIFQHTKDFIYLFTIFDLLENPSTPRALPQDGIDIESLFCPFVIEIDTSGICLMTSYEFASTLGYLITDIVNQPFVNLYPEQAVKERAERVRDILQNRKPFRTMNDTFQGKNGKKRLFDSFFTARYTDKGVFDGCAVNLWPASDTKIPVTQ